MNKPLHSCLDRISADIEEAVINGGVCGAPFVRFTEDARAVFAGIETVIALLQVDDVKRSEGDEREVEETLRPNEVHSLLSLARVVSKVMAEQAEGLADWAEERLAEQGEK